MIVRDKPMLGSVNSRWGQQSRADALVHRLIGAARQACVTKGRYGDGKLPPTLPRPPEGYGRRSAELGRSRCGLHLFVGGRRIRHTSQVDNILKIHSLHPEGLAGHMELYSAVMKGSPTLRKVDREMIAVVVSTLNQCHY